MDWLEKWLRLRPLAISLLLALALICCLGSEGVISEDIMPFGDGEHYILRCLTLYGYLHTGQWSQFWDAFTLPRQSLAPLHYWLFFLLPQGLASVTSYGVIQAVTTYGVLALGVWALCRGLDRAEWAPALFLLCATQNISLDEFYFYHADVPFFAMGTMVLAWQVGAWRDVAWRKSLLSGAGAGMMFWVKPANAVIFAATYLLAEIFRFVPIWFERKKGDQGDVAEAVARRRNLVRHAWAVATGFVPVTLLAMACGGVQSIAKLINANEASGTLVTTLDCSGFLRLFYFPLCLTFFYHTLAMLLIFSLMGMSAIKMRQKNAGLCPSASSQPLAPGKLFPKFFLLPLVLAYFVLGEVFSFGMANKEMRSMLLVLPVFWLATFWGLERFRVRTGLIFAAAGAYVFCAYSQIFFNTFGTNDRATDSYQLNGDWLARLPRVRANYKIQIGFTNGLLDLIQTAMPAGGKVAVGSEHLYTTAESLSWTLQHEPALHGQEAKYEFENFITVDGKYRRSALLNAHGILVFVSPDLQYSREVQTVSVRLVQFCAESWLQSEMVQMIPVRREGGDLLGCLVVAKAPLTNAQITELLEGTHGTELSPIADEVYWQGNRRLTWQECQDILVRWKQRRLGGDSP